MPTPHAASSHRTREGPTCLGRCVLASRLCKPPCPRFPACSAQALPDPTLGERLSHLLQEGFSCLLSPRPRCKGLSPEAGYRAQAQRTLDRQVGAQLALPRQERAAPTGRSDTALGTYLPQPSPTFLRGAMPKAPSPGKSQAGEPPRAAASGGSGKVATRLRPSCPTGWTSSRIATWSTSPAAPSSGDQGHVAPLGKPPSRKGSYLWRRKQGRGTTPYKGAGPQPAEDDKEREIRGRVGPRCRPEGRKQACVSFPPSKGRGLKNAE